MKHITKGAFHLHSTHSDGSGTIPEIAADAKKAGLEWIVITDHNTLAGLHNNEEGWYNGVAVIVGNEISPATGNHYVAAGIDEHICCSNPPEEVIRKVSELGGFGFIAHPDENINRKNKYPPLRWSDWDIKGFGGIEIWNYMSDWVDSYDDAFAVYHLLARHNRLNGPTPAVLNWWDIANNQTEHIVPAVGSLDSHALKYAFLKIFPYLDTFQTITNYICLEEEFSTDFYRAKAQVLNGLKSGHNIIVNRLWNENDSLPYFKIINKSQEAFSGQNIALDEDTKLVIKLPQKADIKLIKDGKPLLHIKADQLELDNLSQGKYRFEAFYKKKPWIFSNPIILN